MKLPVFASLLVLFGSLFHPLAHAQSGAEIAKLDPRIKRVVFLGDSITHSGAYVRFVETYFLTRSPERTIEFLNIGLSSENVSGLSEPGHGTKDVKFPRPDLHERLERVLQQTKPELVFACYGMNDGMQLPFDEARFAAFQSGIRRLREATQRHGVTLIHLTPPVYDSHNPAEPGYDDVLARYSAWLLSQRASGWQVVDLRTPMLAARAAGRAKDPTFTFSKDKVHPNEEGHWIMARALLEYLGARDLAPLAGPGALVAGVTDGARLQQLIKQRSDLMHDAWLTATKHLRPGVKAGLPLAEAQMRADELEREIRAQVSANRIRAGAAANPTPALVLQANDTVLFYGNGMVERLLEAGTLEAHLQLAQPEKKVRVRSLAWTGDEVGHRMRPEGYAEHLKTLVAAWPAKVVVLGYGMNESFAGSAGLAEFRAMYDVHVREVSRRHPGVTLVLLSPLAVDAGTAPAGVNAEMRNRDLAEYSRTIAELARAHGAQFVDLFTASRDAYGRATEPLTAQGIHLTATGARDIGRTIAAALLGEAGLSAAEPPRVAEVARAAGAKHIHNADLVRPKNGALYYGVRKRPEENAAELPRYHRLLELAEAIVHEVAAKPSARFVDFPAPTLPPLEPGKSVTYRFPGGTIRAPIDLQQELVVAEGFALNLFASEEQFPELRSPVQMSFDARGRLWVVTMPSFPHTIPGEQPRDKILILEDTDRDGKADKCTTFADGFDALDGVAFHERGVIVSAQPRLLILNDTDGDGRADTRVELLRGIDVTDSHHGGMVASDPMGYLIFADGVFHRSQFETPFGLVRGVDSTTYRLDPATGRIHPEWQSMTPNPWKVSFDRYGNIFQRYGGGHVLEALPLTWTPLGVYHPYGHATVLNYAKGSALSVVSSPNFPDAFQQGVASASLLGSYIVSVSAVNADAGPIVATTRLDVLSSKNSTFRPVDVEFGFDGALYVSDFSSLIIGHAQHPMRDPQWNHERGRIWRVVHTGKPIVKDWPRIEGAPVPDLLQLLIHPQNIVRHHARIELRKRGAAAIPATEAWLARVASEPRAIRAQAVLEASWVVHAAGAVRRSWLDELLQSQDPLYRTAAVQLVRLNAARLPDALAMLTSATHDPHPRVQMAVINAVAHLRMADPKYEPAIAHLHPSQPAVKQMLVDLQHGTQPRKARSVPVMELSPATRLPTWQAMGQRTEVDPNAPVEPNKKGKAAPNVTRLYRTLVDAESRQSAVLSVKHGFIDIIVNGVQVLSSNSQYSSEQQVPVELTAGLNIVEVAYRRLRNEPPPVYLFDAVGQPLTGVKFPADAGALTGFAAVWEKANAGSAGVLRVQAVPNQMQFSPKELRVKAGQPVRLVFENPDLMPHNLVIVAPGAEEEVGLLADKLAGEPTGLAKHFVPDSPKVLHATPQLDPKGKAELSFVAPKEPGRYPYLCTFPGHWRIMRGVMIVE